MDFIRWVRIYHVDSAIYPYSHWQMTTASIAAINFFVLFEDFMMLDNISIRFELMNVSLQKEQRQGKFPQLA